MFHRFMNTSGCFIGLLYHSWRVLVEFDKMKDILVAKSLFSDISPLRHLMVAQAQPHTTSKSNISASDKFMWSERRGIIGGILIYGAVLAAQQMIVF